MNMTTKRHNDIIAQLERVSERRDLTIARLTRLDGKMRKLKRSLTRLEKIAQRPAAPAREEQETPTPPAAPPTDNAIPTFLRRAPPSAADVAAKAEIEAEQLAQRKTKSRVRVERLKAKQAGDLRKMPVSGKEALALIRGG